MPLELSIVLAILATYRLSQFVALDDGPLDCFATLRGLVSRKCQSSSTRFYKIWCSINELINCPYCLGVWFAGITTIFVLQITPLNVWAGLLIWLGIAGGQCALHSITDASK